jgi:hypothetical protein
MMPFDLSTAAPVDPGFDLSTATPVDDKPPPAQATPETIGSWLKSNVGVPLARSAVGAVTALPMMAEDFGVAARNVFTGKDKSGNYPYELPSQTVQRAMEPYLPSPTSTAGKISEAANSAILGGAAAFRGIPGMTAPTYGSTPSAFVSAQGGLTPAQQNAAQGGASVGMSLTPGQQTGSKALQQFEAKLQSQPWTSGPFNKLTGANQEALNRTWASSIGEGGSSLDSTVLSSAVDRMGKVFENARSPSSIVMSDPKTTSGVLDGIDQTFEGLIPGSIRTNPLVSRLESLTGAGSINGEQLGNLSSKLGRAAANQMTSPSGDREMGQALYAVKDHADDLLQSTLTGKDSAEYAAARQQYRSLMQLTARTTNLNPNTGNVGGNSMASYLQMKDRPGFLYGGNQSDAYKATRFAQAFRPIVGDSGTATRSPSGLGSPTQWPLSVPANLLSHLYLSGPGSAAVRGLMANPLEKMPAPMVQGLMTGIASGSQ